MALLHLAAFNTGATDYAMQRMVVADPLGHLLGFFAAVPIVYLVLVVAMQVIRPLLG